MHFQRLMTATAVALSLALTLPVGVSHAAPADEVDEAEASEAEASEAGVEAALADGELGRARDLAVALREADPSPANHRLEARTWTALGDYARAEESLVAALDALPEDMPPAKRAAAAEAIDVELAELAARSRGTVADEPESTHRDSFDEARAARLAALAPTVEPPPPLLIDEPKFEIHKQWYFWVTLGAIVASAGAIVGLAIKNGVDERNELADSRLPIPSSNPTKAPGGVSLGAGGVLFRF